MTLTIKLELDNAAFEDRGAQEVRSVILDALNRINTDEPDDGKLLDENGNACGSWEVA